MTTTEWSSTTKRLVIVGLIIILLLGLYLFRSLLPPIALATVLAFLLKPVADFVERRTRAPRTLAVVLVFLALVIISVVIPVNVVPNLVDQIRRVNLDLQRLADELITFLSQPLTFLSFSFSLQDLVGDVRGALQGILQPFATQTVGLLLALPRACSGFYRSW